MLKAAGDDVADGGHSHSLVPVEEQIVIVQQLAFGFAPPILLKDPLDVRLLGLAPGEVAEQYLFQGFAGVHTA